jgi:7-alpha-hydroxysteroid dehydrogenase
VNASRQVMVSDALSPEDDNVEAMLAQNLIPALRLSQLVAKRMIKQAGADGREGGQVGSIVNLSSIAARRTHADLLGYSVASAALDQMTRSFAVALAEQRIRVNAVAFGSVMSNSLKETLKDQAGLRSEILDCTPMARIASPAEVADAVQYLASEGSGFVTGQVITIDGGRTLVDPVTAPAH